jgi:tRNA pseudouridine38-40 synthase
MGGRGRDGPDGFHSRACATARRYAYVLLQSPVRPSVDQGRVGWVFQALDAQRMRAAADLLLGEHDFSSFRAAGCQAKSPVKTLRRIDIHYRPAGQAPMRDGRWNAATGVSSSRAALSAPHDPQHHGLPDLRGQGSKPVEWMQQVLEARSREVAAPTFSPDGLYFLGPIYDTRWGLPVDTPPFAWLP